MCTPAARLRRTSLILALGVGLAACDGDGGDGTGPAATGAIQVITQTTGEDPDSDGYSVTVEGETRSVASNGSVTFSDLAQGSYSVQLTGVAPNCSVTGDNPRTVAVSAGATAETTFQIACTALTGAIEVTTMTSGSNLDPDGYTVMLDGAGAQAIGVNDVFTYADVTAGDHELQLTDVASNCSVGGDNPRTITVSGGATVQTTFEVTCQAPSGTPPIIWSSIRDGNDNIYAINPDGTGLIRLTDHPDVEFHAAWSPDGSEIAFHSDRSGNFDLFIMNADGTGATNITNSNPNDLQPAWSPDGSQLVFYAPWENGGFDITAINVDGTGLSRLTQDAADDLEPDWSPDGSQIVFSSERDGEWDIYVMNADGSGVTQLTDVDGLDRDPDWSPDGTQIAFYSERDGNPDIYVMNADGSGVTQITNTGSGEENFDPEWSPDGSQIVFESDRDDDGNFEIYVMNADGSGVVRLTDHPDGDADPSWRADSGGSAAAIVTSASRVPRRPAGCMLVRTDRAAYRWECR